MKLCLIGFGEAGQSIAASLGSEGRVDLRVFDLRFRNSNAGDLLDAARKANAATFDKLADAVLDANIVLSLVVGSAAVSVAADAAQHLHAGQVYVDLNSVSPKSKSEAAEHVHRAGADFIEAAVMARVPPYGHRVPLLLAGSKAESVGKVLNAIGMNTEAVGTVVGQASMNKLLRSIVVKGTEALLFEALTVAEAYGISDRLLDSLKSDFIDTDWRKLASYYLGRTAMHGARRVTEMGESAAMLSEIGFEPVMADAARRRIAWAHGVLRDHRWPNGEPADYREIIAVTSQADKRNAES